MHELLIAAIPLLPLLSAAALWLNLAAGEPLAEKGVRRLASAALAASFLLAASVFAGQVARPGSELVSLGRWIESGAYHVDVALLVDPLSATMAVLSTGFGLLVARFSKNYMHRESGFGRFYAALSLFIAAMVLLVMGGNLVLTFAGWEGVGLCSYLLIGFYYDRSAPASAGTRAFVTNRVGDVGFLAAIFLASTALGTIDYRALSPAHVGALAAADPATATWIALGLLLAAAGKSAQLPLSSWLARAMEGPTPSSALFYAAVMVNAGVYLVVRNHAIFDASPTAMRAMAVIGGATAIYGGLVSLVQTDVKGALIFSTTGQLGLMFLACGLGDYTIATAHLVAHALLRGLQFLTAPSILLRQRPGASQRRVASHGAWLAPLAAAALPVGIGVAFGGRAGASFHAFLAPAGFAADGGRPPLPAFLLIGLALVAVWSTRMYLQRAQGSYSAHGDARFDEARLTGAAPADARRLHTMALHRFWLDDLQAQWIVRPVLRLGRALDRFDAEVVDRAAGRPHPVRRASPAAPVWDDPAAEQLAEHGALARSLLVAGNDDGDPHGAAGHRTNAHAPAKRPRPAMNGGTGLFGRAAFGLASIVNGVEEQLVTRAIGRGIPVTGKLLGRALNHVDAVLGRPVVAGALIAACLAVLLRGAL